MLKPIHASAEFTAIYRLMQPKLIKYLRKFGVQENDLDDLVQECFMTFLTSGRSLNLNSVPAYLITTARHRAIDLWRKQKVAAADPIEAYVERLAAPRQEAMSAALYLEHLGRHVDALDSQHPGSLTFKKFYRDGQSLQEIAVELGEPLGTISGRVFRMRRLLSDRWRRDLENFEDQLERAGFGA